MAKDPEELNNLKTSNEVHGNVVLFVNDYTRLVDSRSNGQLVDIKVENDAHLRFFSTTKAKNAFWETDMLPWGKIYRRFIDVDLSNYSDLDEREVKLAAHNSGPFTDRGRVLESGFRITGVEPPGVQIRDANIISPMAGRPIKVEITFDRVVDHKTSAGYEIIDKGTGNKKAVLDVNFGGQEEITKETTIYYNNPGSKTIVIDDEEFEFTVAPAGSLIDFADTFEGDLSDMLLASGIYRLGDAKQRFGAKNRLPRDSKESVSTEYLRYMDRLAEVVRTNKLKATNLAEDYANNKYGRSYDQLDDEIKLDVVFNVAEELDEKVSQNSEADFRAIINRVSAYPNARENIDHSHKDELSDN